MQILKRYTRLKIRKNQKVTRVEFSDLRFSTPELPQHNTAKKMAYGISQNLNLLKFVTSIQTGKL